MALRIDARTFVVLALLLSLAACGGPDHSVAKSDDPIPGTLVVSRDTDDDDRGELFVIAADGSEARAIPGAEGFSSFALSPDGRTIAANQGSDSGQPIALVDVVTGAVSPVEISTGSYSGMTWSPSGDALAFSGVDYSRFTSTGTGGVYGDLIYVADAAGGNARLLLEDSQDGAMSPAWSHDGTRITFAQESAVWVVDVDGTGNQTVTHGLTTVFEPAWSPVADQIAFTGHTDMYHTVYVVNADGSGMRQISPEGTGADHPVWSPDGNWIAFAVSGPGGNQLHVVRQDGTNRRVIDVSANIVSPAWSPDGEWIAFSSVYSESDGPITAIHANIINPFDDDPETHTLVRDLASSDLAWLPAD